jgi:hypothetical protein
MDKRLAVFEDYIEEEVRSRMTREIGAVISLLEERLGPEEFARVAQILYKASSQDRERSGICL